MKSPIQRNYPNTIGKWLDGLGFLFLALLWAFVLKSYFQLPDQIPTHFNLSGVPDDYGSRYMILFLPGIATLLFIILSAINRRPERFNYPITITPENAAYQYQLASNLIRALRLAMPIIFGLVSVSTIGSSYSQLSPLLSYLLPLILGCTILPLIIYLFLATRKEKIL